MTGRAEVQGCPWLLGSLRPAWNTCETLSQKGVFKWWEDGKSWRILFNANQEPSLLYPSRGVGAAVLCSNILLERGFLHLCSADLGVPSGGAEAIYSRFSLLLYVATVPGCLVGTVGYTRKVGDKLGQWVTLLSYPPVSLLTYDQKGREHSRFLFSLL